VGATRGPMMTSLTSERRTLPAARRIQLDHRHAYCIQYASLQLRIYTELQRLAGAVSSAAIDEVAAFTVVNKQRTAALNRSFITRSGLRARKPEGLRTGPCPVAAPLAGNLDNSRHRPAVRLAGASEVV